MGSPRTGTVPVVSAHFRSLSFLPPGTLVTPLVDGSTKKTPPPSPPGALCPVMSVYTEFRSRMHAALKITSSVTARRPFVSLPASLCDANRRLLAPQTFTTSVDLARKLAVKWTVRRNKFATSIVAIAFTYNTRGGDYRGTGGDTSPQHFGWGTQR